MTALSILVISRTASLLSNFLQSIPSGLDGFPGDVEVMCSWNGTEEEEKKVQCPQSIALYFAQRVPYHFASNMNGLAQRACGKLLLITNDDLIFGNGSIKHAIDALEEGQGVGIVGAKLISTHNQINHAGILFDHDHKPFHRYLNADPHYHLAEKTETVPATTGAFMLTRASDYYRNPFQESYIENGEDIHLCLEYRTRLGLKTIYASKSVCTHDERTTRGYQQGDSGFGNDNSEDLSRMRKCRQNYLKVLTEEEVRNELELASKEGCFCRGQIEQLNHDLSLDSSSLDSSSLEDELQAANTASDKLKIMLATAAIERQRTEGELDIAKAEIKKLQAELNIQGWLRNSKIG